MDLSMLSAPVSEYSKQRTGVPFTVRSASSPSYSLTRRPGFRKPAGISQEERRSAKEDGEREARRKEGCSYFFTQSGTNKEDHTVPWSQRSSDTGQHKEETSSHNISTRVNQNDVPQRTITVSTFDRSGIYNLVCGRRGRTEWRTHNLPSRSKSLDWGGRRCSPVQGLKVDLPMLSSKPGSFISKEAESLEERRTGDRVECVMGRLVSSMTTYDTPGRHHTLERVSRGHSLPSRLKPQTSSVGLPGGQSISERIDKLYGSARLGRTDNFNRMRDLSTTVTDQPLSKQDGQTTASYCRGRPTFRQKRSLSYERISGGTFPRHFSKGDKAITSPVQSRISFWTNHNDINTSGPGSSVSLGTTERAPVGQWQGHSQGKYPEEGGTYWDRRFLDTGTRSLDRARSKFSVAAQIRAARAAEGVSGPLQPNSYLERRSSSFRDPPGFRERRENGSKDVVKDGEEKGAKWQERHAHEVLKPESAPNTNYGIQEEQKKEDLCNEEDVFESTAQKVTLKTTEKKFPELWPFPSAASVRNKINQFEALTQRATGQLPMPKRSFSVPAQFTGTHDGVKKSASLKALGGLTEKSDALKERGEACNKSEVNVTRKEKKFEPEKVKDEIKTEGQAEDKEAETELNPNSEDEVALGLGNQERREKAFEDKQEKKIGSDNNCEGDLGNYLRLKNTFKIPVDGGAESQSNNNVVIDETDFCRVSSPEEQSDRDVSTKSSPSSSHEASTGLLHDPKLSGDQKSSHESFTSLFHDPQLSGAQESPHEASTSLLHDPELSGDQKSSHQASTSLLHDPELSGAQKSSHEAFTSLLHEPELSGAQKSSHEASTSLLHDPELSGDQKSSHQASTSLLHDPELSGAQKSSHEAFTSLLHEPELSGAQKSSHETSTSLLHDPELAGDQKSSHDVSTSFFHYPELSGAQKSSHEAFTSLLHDPELAGDQKSSHEASTSLLHDPELFGDQKSSHEAFTSLFHDPELSGAQKSSHEAFTSLLHDPELSGAQKSSHEAFTSLLHDPELSGAQKSSHEASTSLLHDPELSGAQKSSHEAFISLLHDPELSGAQKSSHEASTSLLHDPELSGAQKSSHEASTNLFHDPEPSGDQKSSHDASTSLLHYPELSGDQKSPHFGNMSPVSDGDLTPTTCPNESPFLSNCAQPQNAPVVAESETESTPVLIDEDKTPEEDLLLPLACSSHEDLPDIFSPNVSTPSVNVEEQDAHISAWVAGLNSKIKDWKYDHDDEDDDDSTEKDEDSNYDSDSAESSVTITSTTSQSDRRSFCVSLADLCNFAGVDYESENDSDEWHSSSRRSASLSSDMSGLSYVSVLPTEELDRLLEDVRGLGDSTLLDYDDVQVVVLHKEVGVGLGFSLAGGVDQNKPITVHKVFRSGVAAQEGSIKEGSQVLSINGTALCGYAHWEALRILRRAKTRELGVVVLRREEVSHVAKKETEANNLGPVQSQFPGTGRRVCLRLEKNDRDLGFSLEGGVGSSLGNRPLIVQKIFLGGPVDKVCPGDEVLEIQGVNVVGMRRLEAWTLIRRLPPGPVDVVLHRPLEHLVQ